MGGALKGTFQGGFNLQTPASNANPFDAAEVCCAVEIALLTGVNQMFDRNQRVDK